MPPAGSRRDLPLFDGAVPPPERADAVRNRRRVLAAARELFAVRGVAAVTMDDIARQAGVGKGTLYRRFGDKGGLAVALLDAREQELQTQLLSGPPPLGPGAPPRARLAAFVHSYVELAAEQLDLLLMSETSAAGARHLTGAHRFWRAHCAHLMREAGARSPDLLAEVLLAALSAEQVAHWLRTEGRSATSVADGLAELALALAQPAGAE